MFVIGAVPGLILAQLMFRFLPESEVFLEQRSRAASAAQPTASPVAGLFRNGLARPTLAFWGASFLGFILVYGLNTWLSQPMITAGYPLQQFLVIGSGSLVSVITSRVQAEIISTRVPAGVTHLPGTPCYR
jgi:AAHS family benzoate transporter-like MFS transporter